MRKTEKILTPPYVPQLPTFPRETGQFCAKTRNLLRYTRVFFIFSRGIFFSSFLRQQKNTPIVFENLNSSHFLIDQTTQIFASNVSVLYLVINQSWLAMSFQAIRQAHPNVKRKL